MHTLSTMRRDMIKIETYWNVNTFGFTSCQSVNVIKIETYWNVNDNGGDVEIMQAILK